MAHPMTSRLQQAAWFRRLMTSKFTSGRIALGEQNAYGIRPEWITIDMAGADYNVDFRRHERLPFPDHSQQLVYSAHTIEHIDEVTLQHVLNECHRILKPGGAIRLEAPDVEKAVQSYQRNDRTFLDYFAHEHRDVLVRQRGLPEVYAEDHIALLGCLSSYMQNNYQVPVLASRHDVDAKLASLNLEAFGQWCVSLQTPSQLQTGGHINPITCEQLQQRLASVGFKQIVRRQVGETGVAGLRLKNLERPHRAFCSFYVEAVA